MSARVVIYRLPRNGRSVQICEAMAAGIGKLGDSVVARNEDEFRHPGEEDIAVFYGLAGRLKRAFEEYPRAGKWAVHIDLGYWGRHHNGNRVGYHKIVVNGEINGVSVRGRHPTPYFQWRKHDGDRAAVFGIKPQPYRTTGKHILVAGMGPKACWVEGLQYEQWERAAIRQIRQVTDRPIIYRPKPSDHMARPIEGTIYSDPEKQPNVEEVLADCHAVVTHHSNVTVDGLVLGVPAFCDQGVALPLGSSELAKIEQPVYPDGREQWISDIAYTQFNVPEMQDGTAWRHLKDEGLVPQ